MSATTLAICALLACVCAQRPEYAALYGASALVVGLVRQGVHRWVVPAHVAKRATTCWFAEHALVNGVLAVLTVPALAAAVREPSRSLDVEYHRGTWAGSPFPLILAVGVHAYHAVFYALTPSDALHHGLFVTLLAVPGVWYDWGALGNAQLFWICGLPGGLVYALLAAQRCGRARALHEPRVTAVVNVLLRCPGICACTSAFVYVLLTGGTSPRAPAWAIAVQLTLAPCNAVYYAVDSVRRHRRRPRA